MKLFPFIFLTLILAGCAETLPEKATEITAMTESVFNKVQVNTTYLPTESVPMTEPGQPLRPVLAPLVNPRDTDFVRVKDYIPEAVTDLKYATADNFTGQVIYEFEDVFLRYGTVMKLKAAAEELAKLGLGLKIWDGFRPVSAQFKLWEICPDDTYVANPNVGYSNHSRGFAVDLTLVDSQGREVEMPTGFDDFSAMADRDYSECSEAARENARLLESVMEKHGFQGYWGEWWHFNDATRYDVESCFDPGVISLRETEDQTALLTEFWDESSEILKIPAGEGITILGYDEGFAMAEYWGYRGYVSMESLK